MAKIKLTGHASGTGILTVTAPNTSTDRTITLPDATATFATTTDVAARLPSITDGGNATAMTIDSSERIGIGTASPTRTVDINHASTAPDLRLGCDGADAPMVIMDSDMSSAADPLAHIVFRWNNTDAALISAYAGADTTNKDDGGLTFKTRTSGSALATRLDLTADGRGLSQFTAKVWVSLNQQGTQYIKDSHNVSSITDYGAGDTHVTFSNAMANASYSCMTGGRKASNWDESLQTSNPATTQISLRNHIGSNGTGADSQHVSCVIFGD